MKAGLNLIAGLLALALVALSLSIFTVDQRQYALVFQFGELRRNIKDPGLYFKWPLVQNVRYFDRRILTIDANAPERFFTSEKKEVLVDSFVKWRIVDPERYYKSFGDDTKKAENRLLQTINAGLREEFGKRTLREVVSGERDKIMEQMRSKANKDAEKELIGVEVIDVRVKRVDLVKEVSQSVYQRMSAERKRAANEMRSQGAAEAERIRADADKQREVIVAEAYREAQEIKGEGDATAADTYAQAFNKDPEFYSFYRSLEAYRNSFKSKNDVIVVEPNSDFFKYMKNIGHGGK